VLNKGKTRRSFEVNGKKTSLIAAYKSATLTVTFAKTGRYTYNCVAKGTLRVT
jgi:plastocyanin